ncbi:MAG: GNAT family protein [Planctomycetota bacterium]|nr:GNAT family protein [Planctomycetota bacterium]
MSRLPMPRPVPVLTGRIVTLRPIDSQRDAADYYKWNLDPEMHVWTGNRVPDSVEEARQELERFVQMDDVTMWAVVDNASGKMIGRFFVCLQERDGKLVAGEGVRIARTFWRKGHNREARRLVFQYVFDILKVGCIETECWSDNINSHESILAHGFTLVKEVLEYNQKHAKEMQKSIFRMTRDEWENLRNA